MSGLDSKRLAGEGHEPALAMAQFTRWVREVSGGAQPVAGNRFPSTGVLGSLSPAR
ncbi:hypothetical protein [Streptomyces sp. NPDC050121]|uniref:hypothetical protein n=1 Tax=Streptomyces sp. NPDC050121 TaxID=3365601 RepID=UPI0037959E8B